MTCPVTSPALSPLIDSAASELLAQRSPAAQRTIFERLAHEAYVAGRHDALMGLRTLPEAAAELGLNPESVGAIARRLGLGWRPHPNVLLLTAEDIERIRTRPRAKPGPKPGPRTTIGD